MKEQTSKQATAGSTRDNAQKGVESRNSHPNSSLHERSLPALPVGINEEETTETIGVDSPNYGHVYSQQEADAITWGAAGFALASFTVGGYLLWRAIDNAEK